MKYVQSCVTSVSFPETLEGVMSMVKDNASKAKWSTDLDTILNFRTGASIFWTAPIWMSKGDILFFYHTKRARSRTSKLLAQAQQESPRKRNLINLLKRAKQAADLYSGTIFACALVSGSTQLFEKQEKHFISRLFAPLEEVFTFGNPLHQEIFADYVRISLNTITPLYNREFNGIKKLISKQNKMPTFLLNSTLGDKTFRNINETNWQSISCLPSTKFNHEGQLRAYLLDFLLNEIKDKGTPILEECQCFRATNKTGIVDYFIKVSGQWIPIEAKLNISNEKDIFAQVAKYTNISSFSPLKGSFRNKTFNVHPIPICLVLDQLGIYFISATGRFINSNYEMPLWRREQFTKDVSIKIREEVKNILLNKSSCK